MAIVDYSKQNEFELVNDDQDCRGWTVVDQSGNKIGTVSEMLVNTETMAVDSVIVDRMKRIPASDFALQNKQVIVRSAVGNEQYANTVNEPSQRANTGETAAATAVSNPQNYAAVNRTENEGVVSGSTRTANEGETNFPVIEEQLQIGKRTVESGGAHVRTEVQEVPVEEQVRLREEHVHVERRPVDRPVTDAPEAFREGIIEIAEYAEVPVVSKETRVIEEVVIGKEITERTETVRETVRRTDVDVDQANNADLNTRGNG